MLQTHTCVSAQCGQCGTRWWDRWDFEPRWPTEAAALRWLAADGWQVRGSVLLCARCTELVACRTSGHVFYPWLECLCEADAHSGHRVRCPDGSCGVQYRSCSRCEHAEERPNPGGCAGVA